jgi:Putative MetA-pathway of phenol degradation
MTMSVIRLSTPSVALGGLLVLLAMTGSAGPVEGQDRNGFMVKIGAAYDRGDFGGTETSEVYYVPVTFRYLGTRWDLSVTPMFASVDTPFGYRLIDGTPTFTGQPSSESGFGDTVLRGRFYLTEERYSESHVPTLAPFFRVKVPTAGDDLSLGTGQTDYGIGVEWDKQVSSVLLFGDVGYTFIGKAQGLDLRNRTAASIGLGHRLSDSVTLSGMLDWRRSIVNGNGSRSEIVGVVSYRLSPAVKISPNLFFGLTPASSDFGAGAELALRFGRY